MRPILTVAWLVATVGGLLALSGCAALKPEPAPARQARPDVPPMLPVPPAMAAATPAGPSTAAAPALPVWSDWLADPALQQLVDLALANNRDLRLAVLAAERAQAQWRATDAARWPTVGVGVGAQRAPNASGVEANTLTAGLQMPAWEIDLFGRVRSLSQAAQAQWQASQSTRRAAELSVTAATVQLALALRADDQLVAIAQRTANGRDETLRLVRLREQAGASSLLDLQSQIGLAAQARATLAQLERQRAQDANALALLLGQPLPGPWRDSTASPASPAHSTGVEPAVLARFGEVPVGLSSDVLLRRPDVVAAEQQLQASRANLAAARAALWPSITLTASAGQASAQLSGLFQGGHFAYSAAANALLTVFDSGRRQAGIDAADAGERSALAQYERTVQAAFRETADALAALETWRRQQLALREALSAARETAKLVDLRVQQGASNLLERLDAERGLFAAEQALVQARLAELSAQTALYKALSP